MRPILTLGRSDKRGLRRVLRDSKLDGDVELAQRCLIVLGWAKGLTADEMAVSFERSLATIYRVRARYESLGVLGLLDRRVDNGERKVDEEFLARLRELVAKSPIDFGRKRSTWTRELLLLEMEKQTGVRVSTRTLARCLRTIGAKWKRGRPTLRCPWPRKRRLERLRKIRRLVDRIGPEEVVVYEDEVDIHLNPKIGPDWMLCRQQKLVLTPGKNVKRYMAGALDRTTGEVHFVEGERKASLLFISLIRLLADRYRTLKRIHVILDNYVIHDSKATRRFLQSLEGRIVLHFLPPYCPGDNPIEGLWKELHANVTRNHRCSTIGELMRNVRSFMKRAAPYPRSRFAQRATG